MTNPIFKKMHVKPGMRLLLLHAPSGLAEDLKSAAGDFSIETTPNGQYPAVLMFVSSQQDVHAYSALALGSVVYDGLLWLAYPKGSSGIQTDINRDRGWEKVRDQGYEAVSAISIDDTWSALRFRPIDRVGK